MPACPLATLGSMWTPQAAARTVSLLVCMAALALPVAIYAKTTCAISAEPLMWVAAFSVFQER